MEIYLEQEFFNLNNNCSFLKHSYPVMISSTEFKFVSMVLGKVRPDSLVHVLQEWLAS